VRIEYGNLETVLGILWRAVASGELTDRQIEQLRAICCRLRNRTGRERSERPRASGFGVMAQSLWSLAKDLPVSALGGAR